MKILQLTQSTDIEQISSVEELFIAKAQLKAIDDGYQQFKMETPEWVSDLLLEVDHEITKRNKGELMRRLKAARARRSALKTADEKRTELDSEINALENALKQ
jgi:hypothetical protein